MPKVEYDSRSGTFKVLPDLEITATEWPGVRMWCKCGIDLPIYYGDEVQAHRCDCGRRYRVKISVTVEEVEGE